MDYSSVLSGVIQAVTRAGELLVADTIESMIKDQEDYVRKYADPDTFSDDFKALIERVLDLR